MIAIDKTKFKPPSSLTDKNRKKAFEKNAIEKKYTSGNKYKTKEVQTILNNLYNKKCAFCEDKLLNSPKHIEHYRPKDFAKRKKCNSENSYFWLSFSWDNLLLACTSCNSSKGSCFDIKGTRIKYSDYKNIPLHNLQTTITELNKIEKPLLVNPEQVSKTFLIKNLWFNFEGKILSKNEYLRYTIRICNLNRKELIEKRMLILNDIRNEILQKKFVVINIKITIDTNKTL